MNWNSILEWTIEHITIVLSATAIAIVVSILLAIMGYWFRPLAKIILTFSDVIQTIPSIALLSLLMIWFGLGDKTMIAGLVLYSLLPIVRNTHTGLLEVPPHITEASKGMGMTKLQRLRHVELPLALPFILTGIRIALVTSLGIAVLGVLIGAGGLGNPVYRGFQTTNLKMLLSGTIPLIAMAVVFDLMLERMEKSLIKRAGSRKL